MVVYIFTQEAIDMKKIIIAALVLVGIAIIYIATPIPQNYASIHLQESIIDAFIAYEQDFYNLNKKNMFAHQITVDRLDDDYFGLKRDNKINLLLNFERSAHHLNYVLMLSQKHYPFLAPIISQFKKWQHNMETRVLTGSYVPYFQDELLFTQLQLTASINNKYSANNFTVASHLPKLEGQIKHLDPQQQCAILRQFGQTNSNKLVDEQVAILASTPPKCNERRAVQS